VAWLIYCFVLLVLVVHVSVLRTGVCIPGWYHGRHEAFYTRRNGAGICGGQVHCVVCTDEHRGGSELRLADIYKATRFILMVILLPIKFVTS
jgi:hypothetical protein